MSVPDEISIRRAKKKVRVKKKNPALAKKKKPPRTAEEREAIRTKQQQCLELRMTGATYEEIAQAVGYQSAGAAKNAVDAVLWRTERDAAKEVVSLDLARLDEFQMRCMYALRNNGDLHQIDRIMRIMEMRYRLLGISDETVRALQSDHGIHRTTINNTNVQVVQASPETEDEFIAKMMRAVGVNPETPAAKKLRESRTTPMALPMAPGSANQMREDAINKASVRLEETEFEDVQDAEIVEE